MSEQAVGSDPPATDARPRSLWVGWVFFGGAMMMLVGTFTVIEGLVALFNDEFYVTSPQGLLLLDITGWGWLHLIVGGIALVVGFGVFAGAGWARACGVLLCGFNAVAHLAFLSAYPAWGLLVIALDVVVIWALVVHGDEAADADR